MKQKKTTTQKLVEEAFDSPAFQASFQVHMRAFGPLLEPAFADNQIARVYLCNALNHISRREVERGCALLDKIAPSAQNDADRAMLSCARGLAAEIAGDHVSAFQHYRDTVACSDAFYFPYTKLARAYHIAAAFGDAAEAYRAAIRCLLRGEANEQTRTQVASLRVNLASTLTMMHDCEAAAEALAESRRDLSTLAGREATEAILAAAMGDRDRVETLLSTLSETLPQAVEDTRRMTAEILAGKHPHFSPVPADPAALDAFWQWGASGETTLAVWCAEGDTEALTAFFAERLAPLSPYLKRTPKVTVTPAEDAATTETAAQGRMTVLLGDYYMVALHTLYEELLARRPAHTAAMLAFALGH